MHKSAGMILSLRFLSENNNISEQKHIKSRFNPLIHEKLHMKILTPLVFLLSFTSFCELFAQKVDIQSRKESLIGTWVFKNNQYFDVMKDDKVQARTGDEIDHSGTWKLSEDGNTFFIMEEGEVVETMNILFVDEYQFAFNPDNGPEEIVLFRNDHKLNLKQKKKLIIGTWEEELDENIYVYEFKKKGTGSLTLNDQKTDLTWVIQEEGWLEVNALGKPRKLTIKSIGTQRLIYQEGDEQKYGTASTLKRK